MTTFINEVLIKVIVLHNLDIYFLNLTNTIFMSYVYLEDLFPLTKYMSMVDFHRIPLGMCRDYM